MTDRERWVIYPLLFLSIGMSLRTKLTLSEQIEPRHIETRDIRCRSLEVTDSLQAKHLIKCETINGNPVLVLRPQRAAERPKAEVPTEKEP